MSQRDKLILADRLRNAVERYTALLAERPSVELMAAKRDAEVMLSRLTT